MNAEKKRANIFKLQKELDKTHDENELLKKRVIELKRGLDHWFKVCKENNLLNYTPEQ